MTEQTKQKLKDVLIEHKNIASSEYDDEDAFVGIYFCDLVDIIDGSINQTKELKRQQNFERLLSKMQSILDVCNQQQSAWACDVTTIVKRLNELTEVVDKMHRNLCVDIADKMVDRVYPPTYNPPCYSPNGICTNPQMDCINCPKRGTGGTWTTNTNINKED